MIYMIGSSAILIALIVFIIALFFIFGILTTLFVLVSLLLIPLILIQKGKGNLGMGALGGGTQMLFGGSGGQDLFQKMTWILGALFMAGSLLLSIAKTIELKKGRFTKPVTNQLPTGQ